MIGALARYVAQPNQGSEERHCHNLKLEERGGGGRCIVGAATGPLHLLSRGVKFFTFACTNQDGHNLAGA